jgi:hypothetical protein
MDTDTVSLHVFAKQIRDFYTFNVNNVSSKRYDTAANSI